MAKIMQNEKGKKGRALRTASRLKKQFPLFKFVYALISHTFCHLSLPQVKNLASLVLTFFYNTSFALYDIAKYFPANTSQKHKYKALVRALDALSLNKHFWRSYVKTIFALPHFRIRSRRYITILLDATTLKEDFWVLAASISYKGRSIPIYLKMWKGVNKRYDYWGRVKKFVKQMRRLLPDRYSYIIVADRGFKGSKLPRWCKELDLDYIIRIQDDYHVRLKDGEEWEQLGLFSSGIYSCSAIGKESQIEGNVVVNEIVDADKVTKPLGKGEKKDKTRAKAQAKWFLQTSLNDKDFVVDTYLKRMQIEESFKDLKSHLYWEKYTEKLPKKDRIEKCVVISCLSYAIQLSIGSCEKISKKEEKMTSLLNRFRNALHRSLQHLSRVMPAFIAVVLVNIYRIDKLFC